MSIIRSAQDLTHLCMYKKFLVKEHFDAHAAALGEFFFILLSNPLVSNHATICQGNIYDLQPSNITWHCSPLSLFTLHTTSFGKLDSQHSFLVEPGLDTCLYQVLCSGFLDRTTLISPCTTHPLILYLASAIVHTRFYDFHWSCTYDQDWQHQTHILPIKQVTLMACLLHYNLDTSLLMR